MKSVDKMCRKSKKAVHVGVDTNLVCPVEDLLANIGEFESSLTHVLVRSSVPLDLLDTLAAGNLKGTGVVQSRVGSAVCGVQVHLHIILRGKLEVRANLSGKSVSLKTVLKLNSALASATKFIIFFIYMSLKGGKHD